MASRHVLTVNQVLEIMLRWLETESWEKAFLLVIPKRKLPQTKEESEGEGLDHTADEGDKPGINQ